MKPFLWARKKSFFEDVQTRKNHDFFLNKFSFPAPRHYRPNGTL
jgi:hypothetical protein